VPANIRETMVVLNGSDAAFYSWFIRVDSWFLRVRPLRHENQGETFRIVDKGLMLQRASID
jgi:hypothetical protein